MTDPRSRLASGAMSRLQIAVVATMVGLNALDGFDVLAISFASPGIATEWGIDRRALGVVLSMELLGMALGSLFLGRTADRIGRRPTMLGCLALMTTGMALVPTARQVFELSLWRVLTGLGVGGLLTTINPVAAEVSNSARKNLSVAMTAIGYPVGAVVGGFIAAQLLTGHDWRSVFYAGAAATASFLPIVWFLVPESVHWLADAQPPRALERINRALLRMGHAPVAALPPLAAQARRRSIGELFAPGLRTTTLLVTLAYSFHVMSFYYLLKWVPKIVVDMGFAEHSAARVLVWANIGGATGGALLGLLAQRFGLKRLTIAMMLLSTVMVTVFGLSPPDLDRLALICACTGFCTNAGMVGMYAIFMQAYPVRARAFGTGFTIGVGRGGSALAPIIPGVLFAAGYKLPAVSSIMALGALLGAAALSFVKLRQDEAVRQPTRPSPAEA